MPKEFDFWAKDYEEAIKYLSRGNITYISFDRDLGKYKTGYDIACWVETKYHLGEFNLEKWSIHSANPVDAENIRRALRHIGEEI